LVVPTFVVTAVLLANDIAAAAWGFSDFGIVAMAKIREPLITESIPGLGTYSVPGWGGDMPPMRESAAPATSPSQVPGTSGALSATPSATPGGVASGNPGGALRRARASLPGCPRDWPVRRRRDEARPGPIDE